MHTLKTAGLVGLLGAFLVACGDGPSSSPTAPSMTDSLSAGSGLSIGAEAKGGNGNSNGGGNGNSNGGGHDGGNGNGNPTPPVTSPAPTTPVPTTPPTNPVTGKVQIEGLIEIIAGLSLTVNGQTVLVPPTAVIRHGARAILFAELQVGDRVHVKATRLEDETLEATEVNVQNPTGNPNDADVNDDGSASVSVSLLDGAASETGPDTGTFRLTRVSTASLPVTSPLTVSFTLTGTAVNGTDYQSLPLTATFLAGAATVDVVVTPVADALAEGSESVILTLTNAAPYALKNPITATVSIAETSVPVVTVSAFDSAASETGLDPGRFRVSRTGSTAAPLTVSFNLSGTAVNGGDYVLVFPFTVTILAGQPTADVVITPIVDVVPEGSETVRLTLIDGTLYDLGTPSFATVTLSD